MAPVRSAVGPVGSNLGFYLIPTGVSSISQRFQLPKHSARSFGTSHPSVAFTLAAGGTRPFGTFFSIFAFPLAAGRLG